MSVRAQLLLLTASLTSAAPGQLPSVPSAPEQPPGTSVIVGQVVDPGTGRGVAGAMVALSAASVGPGAMLGPAGPTPPSQALTTADGRFLFRDLRKGTYTISAMKAGYLGSSYGARRPGGGSAPLDLDDGERVTDIVVSIWKWGAISGTVVDEAGEAVVGLDVRAFRRSIVGGRRQFTIAGSGSTDDRGSYRISGLMPGDYIAAVVIAQAWVPLTVADTFRDAMNANDPARTALMSALMESGGVPPMPGSPTTVHAGSMVQSLRGPAPPPATDESRMFVYPTTYHPAARSVSEATVITLRSGEDRTGIDFDLKPVRTTRVSGSVTGPEGPAAHIALRLETSVEDIAADPEASTVSDASGAFVFASVPAGQYFLRASRVPRPLPTGSPVTIVQSGGGTMISSGGPPSGLSSVTIPSDPTLWATMPLAVGQAPLSGLTVQLQSGSRVRGRLEFDGTAERPEVAQLQRIAVQFEPAAGRMDFRSSPVARVEANGEFATGGVVGGRYFIRSPGGPPGWHFKETRYDGQDLSTTPINLDGRDLTGVTIVFTDRPTDLSGTVRSGRGSGDPDATVLIFPADNDAWQSYGPNPRRMRSVRTSKTGSYKAVGLPPGDYYLAAVPDETATDWQDPRVLASLAGDATRVSLDDGERKTQDVRTQQKR